MIVVGATFIAKPIEASLKYILRNMGCDQEIRFSPYNQVMQQLLDEASMMRMNEKGVNILLIRSEDMSGGEIEMLVDNLEELKKNIEIYVKWCEVPLLIFMMPYSTRAEVRIRKKYEEEEDRMIKKLKEMSNVYAYTSKQMMKRYPVTYYELLQGEEIGHMPYTDELYVAAGTYVARNIYKIRKPIVKVIVADCDNTLWEGVCGEVENEAELLITDEHMALQEELLRQREAGVLLCICSKNEERDVMKVIDNHERMKIKKGEISAYRINWKNKSRNIKEISREIGVGLESIMFIDDNSVEIAEVNINHPQVITFRTPKISEMDEFLKNNWMFDHAKLTEEDRHRARYQKDDVKRKEEMMASDTLREFMKNLRLKMEIKQTTMKEIPRISKLTNRTNQFNFTTIRRSEGEIRKLIEQGYICYSVYVSDRYGDYGLVGVMIVEQVRNKLEIDTLLLSCRTLGKGVEYEMIREIGNQAQTMNIEKVEVNYKVTKKNIPVYYFLSTIINNKSIEKGEDVSHIFTAEELCEVELDLDRPITKEVEHKQRVEKKKHSQNRRELEESMNWAIRSTSNTKNLMRLINKNRTKRLKRKECTAPRTEMERILVQIWERYLHTTPIGIEDEYVRIGGESIAAVKIIAEINKRLEVKLDITDIFQERTIHNLSKKISVLHVGEEKKKSIIQSLLGSEEGKRRMTRAQRQLWVSEKMFDNRLMYNMVDGYILRGEALHVEYLERALNEILKNNEIFNMKYYRDEPMMLIRKKEVLVERENIADETIEDIIKEEQQKQFREGDKLVRVKLYKRQDEEYILTICMHHIITDEHSLKILYKEVSERYNNYLCGTEYISKSVKNEYHERDRVETLKTASEEYWKIYSDMFRTADKIDKATIRISGRAKTHSFQLCNVNLKELARNCEVTQYILLLTMIQVMMRRYYQIKNPIINVPYINRETEEELNTYGLYTIVMPFINIQKEGVSFIKNMYSNREKLSELLEHRKIVLQRIETLSKSNDVLYAHYDEKEYLNLASVEVERRRTMPRGSEYKLVFITEERGEYINMKMVYSIDIYQQKEIEEIEQYLKRLADLTIKMPNIDVDKIPIFGEIVERSYDIKEGSMVDMFTNQLTQKPNSIAIVCKEESITYSELNDKSDRMAAYMKYECEIEHGNTIGVGMKSSIEMFIGILAILKLGAIYIPLDNNYPREYLDKIVEKAKPRKILDEDEVRRGILKGERNIIREDEVMITGEDEAYIIFTSGSTGEPKGVRVQHRSAVNATSDLYRKMNMEEGDAMLQMFPMNFDGSIAEWGTSLLNGGKLVIFTERDPFDVDELIKTINDEKNPINIMITTPSLLSSISGEIEFRALHTLMIAGEAHSKELLRTWKPKVKYMMNGYGPTEGGMCTTVHTYDDISCANIIGRPLYGVNIYILSEKRELLPRSAIGEIYIGGIGLAKGYISDERTKERYIRKKTRSGEIRMYRSGDMARYNKSEELEYIGRKDREIKASGYRIHMTEIESAINEVTGVSRSIVVYSTNKRQMRAHIVSTKEVYEVKQELQAKLPRYMWPQKYINHETLELLPHGKIDYEKLDQSIQSRSSIKKSRWNHYIYILKGIWQEVMAIKEIDESETLISLGASSLNIVEVKFRIKKVMNMNLSIQEILTNQSIELCARMMMAKNIKRTIEPKCILPINMVNARNVLYLIHPLFGLAVPYLKLREYMKEYEIYGMSDPYIDDERESLSTKEEMVEYYAKLIIKMMERSAIKESNITMGGWSFGGIIGLDVANYMIRRNYDIKRVILIDSYHPDKLNREGVNILAKEILLEQGVRSNDREYLEKEHTKNIEILNNYEQSEYNGQVVLIKVKDEKGGENRLNGWEELNTRLKSRMKVYEIEGEHSKLFDDDNIERLAILMKLILQ